MIRIITTVLLVTSLLFCISFTRQNLRHQYSRPAAQWPAPWVDDGVTWTELAPSPPVPADLKNDTIIHKAELGKALFFDPRLSSSGKISCASCHDPALNWTDGKERSVGHNGTMGKRNAPTIQNAWFYKKLFWDGRARDLQDQAFAPIVSESEMNSEMPEVMDKLRRINGYRALFNKAFGTEEINPDRMTEAIAVFEKTISPAESRFDKFVKGDKRALSNSELRGLHLFRTKARCFNCHNGPLFTDNQFHQVMAIPLFPYDSNDLGLYKVTHKEADKRKFRTPSLRDVMHTGPWFHDGTEKDMVRIITLYHKTSPTPSGAARHLDLSGKEQEDLRAFLASISAPPKSFNVPVLPQ